MLQVDLCIGRRTNTRAKRASARGSGKVDLSNLQGFHLRFAPKLAYFKLLIEAGRSCLFVVAPIWFRPLLIMTTCVALFYCPITQMTENTPTEAIDRVCVSPGSKESICLLCAKNMEKRITKEG